METKKKGFPKIILIILVAVAVIAGGVFGWCGIQSSRMEQALANKDFDTAIACCQNNFLAGDEALREIKYAQGMHYLDQRLYTHAITVFTEIGAQEELAQAIELQGKKFMNDRDYVEAMEFFAGLGEAGAEQWQQAAAGHIRDLMNQGKFDDAEALLPRITDPELSADLVSRLNTRKFMDLNEEYWDTITKEYIDMVEFEKYPEMKALVENITDRGFLSDWDYNDFTAQYAADCILEKDFETAIEFFGYSTNQYDLPYADVLRCLLDQDFDGALEILDSMEYTNLRYDLDMSWSEIFAFVAGLEKDEDDLGSILLHKYIDLRCTQSDNYNFSDWAHGFAGGEPIGPIEKSQNVFPVEDPEALYAQCGTDPQGKVLILRTQRNYPQDGTIHYSVETYLMGQLPQELYPKDLSQVQYVILLDYDFFNAGNYVRTFTYGDDKQTDTFAFLRVKGRISVTDLTNDKTLFTSPWVNGTGEADVWGAEVFQVSNKPDLTDHFITAVEKIQAA